MSGICGHTSTGNLTGSSDATDNRDAFSAVSHHPDCICPPANKMMMVGAESDLEVTVLSSISG